MAVIHIKLPEKRQMSMEWDFSSCRARWRPPSDSVLVAGKLSMGMCLNGLGKTSFKIQAWDWATKLFHGVITW